MLFRQAHSREPWDVLLGVVSASVFISASLCSAVLPPTSPLPFVYTCSIWSCGIGLCGAVVIGSAVPKDRQFELVLFWCVNVTQLPSIPLLFLLVLVVLVLVCSLSVVHTIARTSAAMRRMSAGLLRRRDPRRQVRAEARVEASKRRCATMGEGSTSHTPSSPSLHPFTHAHTHTHTRLLHLSQMPCHGGGRMSSAEAALYRGAAPPGE